MNDCLIIGTAFKNKMATTLQDLFKLISDATIAGEEPITGYWVKLYRRIAINNYSNAAFEVIIRTAMAPTLVSYS